MSKITIENYRGFDIEFDTYYEKFQCIVTEENIKESKSFTAVKKFIDDYKKDNKNFTPFWVESNPSKLYGKVKRVRIVGIRKDNRFIGEFGEGITNQISEYELSDYMLVKNDNEIHLSALLDLEEDYDKRNKKYREDKQYIIEKIDVINLKDYKKTLLNEQE